jgi:hypothetical protein
MLIRILACAALTIPFISIAPAQAGPIPCLDGSTVEFGQLCPPLQVTCSDGTQVPLGRFCPAGTKLDEEEPAAAEAPPPANNRPPEEVVSQCSTDGGVWNTALGRCDFPAPVKAPLITPDNCSQMGGIYDDTDGTIHCRLDPQGDGFE